MTPREITEQNEQQMLCEHATLSVRSRGREVAETPCDLRTDFCRDRDRIIHCKSFRRLKQKTQVFLSPEGDHYRTRLTHTLEVSQIARTVARALRLNEDLTEAIAMGHDLGHTPFGHAGERALNSLNPGGFRHYEQSVRVVKFLEKNKRGLNLTFETLEGIENHTRGDWPRSAEGCAVRYADRIAYLNHDIEDAVTAGALREEELPPLVAEVLGSGKSRRITTLITALVNDFDGNFHLAQDIQQAYDALHAFMFERIYLNELGAAKSEEHKVERFVAGLFEHYTRRVESMPLFYREIAEQEGAERAATDYISGMTDTYAIHCYETLFIPKSWGYEAD